VWQTLNQEDARQARAASGATRERSVRRMQKNWRRYLTSREKGGGTPYQRTQCMHGIQLNIDLGSSLCSLDLNHLC
jgi:hypothetical protein